MTATVRGPQGQLLFKGLAAKVPLSFLPTTVVVVDGFVTCPAAEP